MWGSFATPDADAQQSLNYGAPSTALESNHVFKTAGGQLYDFQVNFATCGSPPCWVMLFDATAAPADGAVTPKKWWQVNANQTLGVSWLPDWLNLLTGITLVCSTTGPFTKTATTQCTFSGDTQ